VVGAAVHSLTNVTLVERPVRPATLISSVLAGLKARERQYQIRTHLAEQKRVEESLREADRRKDEFLATLAHELRNPLAPIRNSMHILRLSIANDPRAEGTTDIVICDTLGQAVPAQVAGLVARVRDESPARRIVYHGHDTWGLGVANTLAAIQAGAAMVDGALGGLGGCPFAPGASGNTSSEDILFATRPDWLTPGIFGELVVLSETLLAELDEPNRSKSAQGARSKADAFDWVVRS